MNHHKLATILLPVLSIVMLSGCWDSLNIEDRGFVAGTAIDLPDDFDEKDPEYIITNQFVLPKGFAANPAQSGNDQKVFLNISSKGRSVQRINKDMSAKTNKVPYFEHLKILIISEKLAKSDGAIVDLLDYYLRNVNIRRGILIAVSEKEAKDILDFEQLENKLPALYVKQLLEQSTEQAGYYIPMSVGDIEELNMKDRSYVLPYLTKTKDIERRAAAVFHGPSKKMVGLLAETELQGLELFNGRAIENVVDFKYKDKTFAFQVIRMRKKIEIDTSDIQNLKIKNNIIFEGIVKESFAKENFMDKKELENIEKAAEKAVKKNIHKMIEKTQNEFNTDILKIWQVMETKHFDLWEKIKNDWETGDNLYSKADFNIQVETNIYSTGTSNKTD